MMRQPWDKMIHGSMNLQQKNPWQNDQIQNTERSQRGTYVLVIYVTCNNSTEILNASSMNDLMFIIQY